MNISPTQRSLAWLRDQGYLCQVVEHWNAHAHVRRDLFGFIDILAVDSAGTLAVQTTSGAHVAERIAKIRGHENFPALVKAGWRIEVHGWRRIIGDTGKKEWKVRVEMVT